MENPTPPEPPAPSTYPSHLAPIKPLRTFEAQYKSLFLAPQRDQNLKAWIQQKKTTDPT